MKTGMQSIAKYLPAVPSSDYKVRFCWLNGSQDLVEKEEGRVPDRRPAFDRNKFLSTVPGSAGGCTLRPEQRRPISDLLITSSHLIEWKTLLGVLCVLLNERRTFPGRQEVQQQLITSMFLCVVHCGCSWKQILFSRMIIHI